MPDIEDGDGLTLSANNTKKTPNPQLVKCNLTLQQHFCIRPVLDTRLSGHVGVFIYNNINYQKVIWLLEIIFMVRILGLDGGE